MRDAYAGDTYHRLVALKHEYDPRKLFRLNQNIAPSNELEGAIAATDAQVLEGTTLRSSRLGRTAA